MWKSENRGCFISHILEDSFIPRRMLQEHIHQWWLLDRSRIRSSDLCNMAVVISVCNACFRLFKNKLAIILHFYAWIYLILRIFKSVSCIKGFYVTGVLGFFDLFFKVSTYGKIFKLLILYNYLTFRSY